MRILAIETSCDETAIALVEASGGLKSPKFKVLKNLVASQIKTHRPYGGVVPNLAKREHLKNLPILWQRIMNQKSRIKNKKQKNIIHNSKFIIPDIVAVTVGPGLEPCLWTGVNFAKSLYQKLKTSNRKLKLIGVNHLEGHLYSFLLSQKTANPKSQILNPILFPAVSLLVSGGHTILLKMDSLTKWKKLGETRDDAVGEAFDKVARMLNLPFPGGPEIEKIAKRGRGEAINFPRPMMHTKNYDFSFSGLKTSVLYYLKGIRNPKLGNKNKKHMIHNSLFIIPDIAASFQQAAIDVLVAKIVRAAKEFHAKSIMLSGGVAANKELRHRLSVISRQLSVNFFAPPMKYNTDNAAMIAAAAYINYLNKKNRRPTAQSNLNL